MFGERPCPYPEWHHYEPYTERLITEWKADDRAQAVAVRKAEERALHGLAERGPIRGQFSAIGRDVYFGQQPQYYIVGLGISGLTFRPFAKVRLASSYVHLFVDIGEALKGESKSRRRKAIRYGRGVPEAVRQEVGKAVRHYLG